ncbi:MAG: peptide chain release factor family protein [Planctomycetia bacterium]
MKVAPVHPAALPPADLLAQCEETRTRRSGPGGQHRNKVETAVVLVHRPTGLSAEGSERRSQAENRAAAVWRLRLALAQSHREPPAACPAPRGRSRVRGSHLLIAADHDDYPAIVAEAVDRLHAVGFEMRPAADVLGVSPSQLTRLFRKVPAAWVAINRWRSESGLPPLK